MAVKEQNLEKITQLIQNKLLFDNQNFINNENNSIVHNVNEDFIKINEKLGINEETGNIIFIIIPLIENY